MDKIIPMGTIKNLTILNLSYKCSLSVTDKYEKIVEALFCSYTRNNIFSWNQEAYFLSLNFFLSATTSPNDADVAAVASRIEELVASVKRRSQRLYKDSDGCKGRARIRRKIREEKKILNSVVEKYNTLVPNAEKLTLDTILSDEIVWPWQLTHGGMYTIPLSHSGTKSVMSRF